MEETPYTNKYLGCLEPNYLGTNFILYDHGLKDKKGKHIPY
jgi:hypothetical protein